MLGLSFWLLRRGAEPGSLLSPPVIALLLIAILLPAIALMALYARKVAVRRAEQGGLGSGRLHIRLVALFTVSPRCRPSWWRSLPRCCSKAGLEFWFSNRARSMLENAVAGRARTYAARSSASPTRPSRRARPGRLSSQMPIDDPRFAEAFARLQVYNRGLSEAIIFTYGPDKQIRTLALVNPYDRPLERRFRRTRSASWRSKCVAVNSPTGSAPDQAGLRPQYLSLCGARFRSAIPCSRSPRQRCAKDYRALLDASRLNQLRFNAALLLGALIIVGLSILRR